MLKLFLVSIILFFIVVSCGGNEASQPPSTSISPSSVPSKPLPSSTPQVSPTPIPPITPPCEPGHPCPVPSPEPQEPLYQTGYIPSGKGLASNAPFILATRVGEVPIRFSWIAAGFDIAVRDQGHCGACWSFATLGVVNWSSKIFLDKEIQLAPQYQVSRLFFGCMGGEFSGQDVVDNGAPLEADCPYQASSARCPSGISPALKGKSVVNIGVQGRAPTTLEIQEAILQYGPLAAGVAATTDWQKKGPLNSRCSGRTLNHMVEIYGWDDTGWLGRNSWGEKWGNKGNFQIKFGCDNIATEAATVLVQ